MNMALTINRKGEISDKEFILLKNRFKKKTNSQAIYACVKFMVNDVSDLEVVIDELNTELEEIRQKHIKLIETIKKKHVLDNEFETIVFSH